MTRLKLDIDTRSLKNGAAQIRLRINHKGTSAYVGTGVYVEPQYFIGTSLYDPVSRKAPMVAIIRERVGQIVGRVDKFLMQADQTELDGMNATDIREAALGATRTISLEITNGAKKTAQKGDFVSFFENYGENRRTIKTQESYAYGAKVLREYCAARRLGTLTFTDIDYPRLVDFARWLDETGRSAATRHMIESYVRAAYRDGQKRRLVSRDLDPYYDYSIARVPLKDIETLSVGQMHALMECEPKLGGQRMGRDIALMSFYLCGANLIDLYEMQDGKTECVFIRHKIEHRYQQEIHIRIEPELAALITRYKGNGMLLAFKAKYPNYETFRHKIAHRLRELSRELGFSITLPKIRRTWASIAGGLDIADRVIDKSMGHVDTTVKDRHYERYDWSRTARANRSVIDAIIKL